MDPSAVISKISTLELGNLQLQEIKKLASFMNLSVLNKRKDAIIDDISKILSYMVFKPTTKIPSDAHLINYDLNYVLTDPHLHKIIQKYRETVPNQDLSLGTNLISKKPEPEVLHLPAQSNSLPKPLHSFSENGISSNLAPCLCGEIIKSEVKGQVISCINQHCKRRVHINCVKFNSKSDDVKIFECFDCVLKACDPLHEVVQVLSNPTLLNNKKIDFFLEKEIYSDIKANDFIGVEIRCIRLEEKSIEPTWPHQGDLQLNGRRELEFRPLQANSSLKKRKDEKLFSRNVVSGLNNVSIRFNLRQDYNKSKQPETETYVAGIYLIKKLQPKALISKVKQNNLRSVEECKVKIADQFANEAIQIDKLSYTLFCVLDMQPLKTPAKGLHCKHVNCFSLENYINVWYKNNQRKWQCPICKLKAYDIVIDTYFQEILQAAEELGVMSSESPDVTFNSKGEYTFTGKEKEVLKINEKKIKPESGSLEESKTKVEGKNPANKKVEEAVTIVLDDSDEEMRDEKAERTKESSNPQVSKPKGERKKSGNKGPTQSKPVISEKISQPAPLLSKIIDIPKMPETLNQITEALKLIQPLNPSAAKTTFEPVILTKPVTILTPIEKPQTSLETKNDVAMDIVDESPKSRESANNPNDAKSDSSSVIEIEAAGEKPKLNLFQQPPNLIQSTFIPEMLQQYDDNNDKENYSLSQLSIAAIENSSNQEQYQAAALNGFERIEIESMPVQFENQNSFQNENKTLYAGAVNTNNLHTLISLSSRSNSIRDDAMISEEAKPARSHKKDASEPIASKQKLNMLFEKQIEKRASKDQSGIEQGIIKKTISKKKPETPQKRPKVKELMNEVMDSLAKEQISVDMHEKGNGKLIGTSKQAAASASNSGKTVAEKTNSSSAADKKIKLQGNVTNPICLDDDD